LFKGGYGILKIINKVDFSALKKNPNGISISDITVLHMWISEVCGIMSVHGDMLLTIIILKRPGYFQIATEGIIR